MLKFSLSLLMYFITLYLIGDRIRLNPKIDKFIGAIEGRYSKLNELLENVTVKEGLFFLRKTYGFLSIISFTIIILIMKFRLLSEESILYTYPIFLLIFLSWFSIQWVTEHKKTVFKNLLMEVIIVLSPLMLIFLDFLADTNFIKILSEPIYGIIEQLHIYPPSDISPVIIGGVVSLFLLAFFFFNYLLSWLMLTPFFLLSIILVIVPIKLARFLSILNKNDSFFWLAIVILTIATFWHAQL
ncbi:hypothetical protein [Yersinia pseudotuberculosis]|uniref:hypothetical protein n=1 Tax=Yersinia pseudotuberculosis TaxID=633 RepID=UPI000F6D347C|nr:hypothetical protein [Yersinia pseudotuberculosis]VEE72854.1 Uncharacterised protein [Yersinia pseudotuberculosis]